MTKNIEDELGLPRLEDALKAQEPAEPAESENPVNPEVEQMANALQTIGTGSVPGEIDPLGTGIHELEANDIYDAAMKAYKDLLDLGFNIESKHAGANAFAPAAKMLEIALKASQSKSNKKLERIKALMEKERHDREMQNNQEEGVIEGENGPAIMAFRKDMIDRIRKGEI